jgi:hypothetical protein
MKLPIALATLFLAATTALPAFAANTAPRDAARYQQDYGYQQDYRSGTNAYAASPRAQRPAVAGWGHCISRSVDADSRSAYPSWDICSRG